MIPPAKRALASKAGRLRPASAAPSTTMRGRWLVHLDDGTNVGGHPTRKEAEAWAAGWNAATDILKETIVGLEAEVEESRLPHPGFFGLWRMGGAEAMRGDFPEATTGEVIAAYLDEVWKDDEPVFRSYVLGQSVDGQLWLHNEECAGGPGPWRPAPIEPEALFSGERMNPPYLAMQHVVAWMEAAYGWPQLRAWQDAASLAAYEATRAREIADEAATDERERDMEDW